MKSCYLLRIVILLFFGLLSSINFAQQILELDKRVLIKTSPMALLEPETIIIQGGIEYFLSPKFSIQTELGVNAGLFGIPSGRGKNEQFSMWRTKNELKFYSKKNYWGVELFFVSKDFIRTDDYYVTNSNKIWYDRAHIDFQIFGTGLKFGRQEFVSENISLDSYLGIGIRSRYRLVNALDISPNQVRDELNENFLTADRYRFNRWDNIPHLTLGIKVGILPQKR
ncbi:DUF3575 domain-containing protein [Algoriphagus yeomjeoni]|uniref:Uncharacterized protein DUF3575 n=1 Tax=Algoriphagus yeomjeoni TaxID=291403 RepID=A0A327P815_9BACT|nr:DUF3575 domain-containing protein [Algoriphagus yeomjeoni]RAI87072.1 uncharacterized protein DUF3575 [Algoriphagus yeomjeoni]